MTRYHKIALPPQSQIMGKSSGKQRPQVPSQFLGKPTTLDFMPPGGQVHIMQNIMGQIGVPLGQ